MAPLLAHSYLCPTSHPLPPISLIPYDNSLLYDELHDSILNSRSISIMATSFLNPDRSLQAEKVVFSVVLNVNPGLILTLLPCLHLFSGSSKVDRAYFSYLSTQCPNCWEFGLVKEQCRILHRIRPLCPLHHSKNEPHCPNPSCP